MVWKLAHLGWWRLTLAAVLLLIIASPVWAPPVIEFLGLPAPREMKLESRTVTYAMWFLGTFSLVLAGVFLFLLVVSLYSESEDRRSHAPALSGTILNWFLVVGTGAAGLIGFTRF